MTEKYILGLDIGGTFIKAGLVNEQGELKDFQTIPTNAFKGSSEVLTTIISLIQSYQKQELIKGIGIALAGSIDEKTGICLYSPNLNWTKVKIGEIIKEATNTEVKLINDANAACLGEYFWGAGSNFKNILCLTIGTGIGTGVIFNNMLFTGSSGLAPEAGHMVLKKDGAECSCGSRGCWETLVSQSAIIERTNEKMNTGTYTMLNKFSQEKKDAFTIEEIFAAWQKGDPLIEEIMKEVKGYLALGLANLVNILNPECIILGGGVVEFNKELIFGLEDMIKELTFPTFKDAILIKKAKLGNKAGLIGAGSLFFKDIKTIGG